MFNFSRFFTYPLGFPCWYIIFILLLVIIFNTSISFPVKDPIFQESIHKSYSYGVASLSTPVHQSAGTLCPFFTTPECRCSTQLIECSLAYFFTAFEVRCSALPVRDVSTCIYSGSIHNKVTKFYACHQPTTTLLIFPGLGLAVNKIYDTKQKHL